MALTRRGSARFAAGAPTRVPCGDLLTKGRPWPRARALRAPGCTRDVRHAVTDVDNAEARLSAPRTVTGASRTSSAAVLVPPSCARRRLAYDGSGVQPPDDGERPGRVRFGQWPPHPVRRARRSEPAAGPAICPPIGTPGESGMRIVRRRAHRAICATTEQGNRTRKHAPGGAQLRTVRDERGCATGPIEPAPSRAGTRPVGGRPDEHRRRT